MIQQKLVSAMRPQLTAPVLKAAPKALQGTVKAATTAERQLANVMRAAAPPETAWYRFKKKVIDFFSNINVAKREVHLVTNEMAERVAPKLRPGDILLRRTDGTSGNAFIPSWWKHAGVYVGEGEVVEAVFKGVDRNTFKKFMTDGDSIMIVRPKNLSPQQREAIATYAVGQVGKPYDFDFNFVDELRLSCTELASHAVKAGAGKELVEKNWLGAVTGDAFKNSNFELIWSNVPKRAAF